MSEFKVSKVLGTTLHWGVKVDGGGSDEFIERFTIVFVLTHRNEIFQNIIFIGETYSSVISIINLKFSWVSVPL